MQTATRGRTTRPTRIRRYEDRAFGGAGLDILIGNTGGDRLIDWVGEFNSYLVPFAPFGIATVSRQNDPQLPEFLYALSRAPGRRPDARVRRQPAATPARNGEPYGELGLVTQEDHGLWQQQTGSPSDPQAGNIPGGRRDVLRSADFNDGKLQGFARRLRRLGGHGRRAAASRPPRSAQDAAAVFYLDELHADLLRDLGLRCTIAEADRRLEGERLRHLRLLLADRLQVRRHRRRARTRS